MRITILIALLCLQITILSSQKYQYEIALEPLVIENLGGLHSYAFATHNDEWLIIGGRLDGLHQRQPFAAFDAAGNNINLIVVNPETKKVWKSPLANLSTSIQEQLASTNMQFIQEEENLILTGGYALSASKGEHMTFPYLTVINVPSLMEAVKTSSDLAPHIQQIEDQKFAVTGGRIAKMNDLYYLIGGHKFTGSYNPMGPTHGPGFVQEYTFEARPFTLDMTGGTINVHHLPAIHDEMNLRRRDYNLLPQIKDGKQELMVFSGVFQQSADVPWLYPVRITENGAFPMEDFTQHFNHYHCANLPIYNATEDEMHNIFMGGIAQFYEENGILVQDNDVPFVKTIADVVRTSNGSLIERKHQEEMPYLLGAGSEMILTSTIPTLSNGVIDGDKLGNEPITIGYVYGGIKSTLPHVFWINTGAQSEASSTVFKVRIHKKLLNSTIAQNEPITKLLIYPNPAQNNVRLAIELDNPKTINIDIFDMGGHQVSNQTIEKSALKAGQNYLILDKANVAYGTYLYKFKIGNNTVIRKVSWIE